MIRFIEILIDLLHFNIYLFFFFGSFCVLLFMKNEENFMSRFIEILRDLLYFNIFFLDNFVSYDL